MCVWGGGGEVAMMVGGRVMVWVQEDGVPGVGGGGCYRGGRGGCTVRTVAYMICTLYRN